jgi:hypothetical protein
MKTKNKEEDLSLSNIAQIILDKASSYELSAATILANTINISHSHYILSLYKYIMKVTKQKYKKWC